MKISNNFKRASFEALDLQDLFSEFDFLQGIEIGLEEMRMLPLGDGTYSAVASFSLRTSTKEYPERMWIHKRTSRKDLKKNFFEPDFEGINPQLYLLQEILKMNFTRDAFRDAAEYLTPGKMPNKPPKFLIAENPMAAEERRWVFHLRNPRFYAEIHPDAPNGEALLVEGSLEWIDDPSRPERIPGMMKRLRDWYIAYLTSSAKGS